MQTSPDDHDAWPGANHVPASSLSDYALIRLPLKKPAARTRPQICGREDAVRGGSVLGDADLERCVGRAIAFQCAIDQMNAPVHLGSKIMSWVTARIVRPETSSQDHAESQTPGRWPWNRESRSVRRPGSAAGSLASARATATRWRWPPESWSGRLSIWPSKPNEASRSPARSLCSLMVSLPSGAWAASHSAGR
jgi:hypothetical protein